MFLVMAEKDCTTMRKMLHDPDFPVVVELP